MPLAADSNRRGCPYLGLDSDWATHYPYPHDRHRCYGYRLPAQISEGRQRFYCLSEQPHLCPQRVVQAHQESTVAATADFRRTETPPHLALSKPYPAGAKIALAGIAGSVAILGILAVAWVWILRAAADPGSLHADAGPRVAASMPEDPPEPPPGVVLGIETATPATAQATAPASTPGVSNGMALPGGSAPVPTQTPSVATPAALRITSPSSTPASRPSTYPAPTASARTHVIEAGDNVYRLALKYGVTVEQIARANNLDERYTIRRGQVLVIP